MNWNVNEMHTTIIITKQHHLCAFLLYLARWLCVCKTSKKKLNWTAQTEIDKWTCHTTFDNSIINTDTRKQNWSTGIQTNPFPLPSLHPSSSSPQTNPSLPIWNTPFFSPHWNWICPHQMQPIFFTGGFSRHPVSRSPREGVDTCRDRALNASERGY